MNGLIVHFMVKDIFFIDFASALLNDSYPKKKYHKKYVRLFIQAFSLLSKSTRNI